MISNSKMKKTSKKVVVFSGAGMSAESGLKTFRDHDGLWENYRIEEVATPEAWAADKAKVLEFYNMRRRQLMQAKPNEAHALLAKLEATHEVHIITQNIDNLHEKAGSTQVLHLHGELMKAQSERHPELIYELDKSDINLGDSCENGHQLRPNVVWFGEAVPKMQDAAIITSSAEILIVIGTSLNVYPAASLIYAVPKKCNCYLVDPKAEELLLPENWTVIRSTATEGVKSLLKDLGR